MTIIPIFGREMIAAARSYRIQSERASFAGQLMLVVVGSFAAWYYWAGGVLDIGTMTRLTDECVRWGVAFHGTIAAVPMIRGASAIARERDRRTLDFLLITRMTSVEIVLGKLSACVAIGLGIMASGFPLMLVLHLICGLNLSVIFLAYAGFVGCLLLLSSLAIWISTESPDARTASAAFLLCAMAWMIGPFSVSVFVPRLGMRMPGWLAGANWWLVASSPVWVTFQIALGLNSWAQLSYHVGRMIGLDLIGTALFTFAAVVRLRPAHRATAGADRPARRRKRRRLAWHWLPRPPVGDDPIYWREKYTSRRSGLLNAVLLVVVGSVLAGLAAGTIYFALPAFAELSRHGYRSAATAQPEPEQNLFVRALVPRTPAGGAVHLARTDFNLFIRHATTAIAVVLVVLVGGVSAEVIGRDRVKGSWSCLLATPLGADDMLRSALKSTAWRTLTLFAAVFVLWTVGLAAGAIHPLGYAVALLELAASSWLMSAFGVLGSIEARTAEASTTHGLRVTMPLITMGVLPLLLPEGLNPVVLGAGSLPLMLWTSLVSYQEVASALGSPLDPHFRSAGLPGEQMPLLVVVSWLLAVVGPILGGRWAWHRCVARFDRAAGRPIRPADPAGIAGKNTAPAAASPH